MTGKGFIITCLDLIQPHWKIKDLICFYGVMWIYELPEEIKTMECFKHKFIDTRMLTTIKDKVRQIITFNNNIHSFH